MIDSLDVATPRTRPIKKTSRLVLIVLIAFTTFALAIGLFALIEHRSSRLAV